MTFRPPHPRGARWAIALFTMLAGCGDDVASNDGAAGASGAGGSGVIGGASGAASSGGGNAGTSTAGASGSGGDAGTAGTGAGGAAGVSGAGGSAGTGGASPSCGALPPEAADSSFPETDGPAGATALETEANRRIRAIAKANDTVYVGGTFTKLGGATRNRAGAFDAQTAQLLAWNPNVDGEVRTLAVSPDGKFVYIGGEFEHVGGVARKNFAKVSASTGVLDTSFDVPVPGGVYQIATVQSSVYLAGSFVSVAGQSRGRVARLDATTGNLAAFDPELNDTARNVLLSPDGKLAYVAGKFTSAGGQSRIHIAALDTSDATPTTWSPTWPANPSAPQPIYDAALTPDGSRLLVAVAGGGNNGGNRVRAFEPVPGKNDELWFVSADGDHQGIAANDQYAFVGGHWDYVYPGGSTITRKKFYVVNVSDGGVVDWDAGFNSITGVHEVFVDCDALYVGGSFTAPAQGLAVLPLP